MPTYLYIHESRTDSPQHRFRSEYELRAMDYELWREVSSKGEIISDVAPATFIPVVGWGVALGIGVADAIWGEEFYNWIEKELD